MLADSGFLSPAPPAPPKSAAPLFDAPAVVIGVVVALLGLHALREFAPDAIQNLALVDFAFLPGRLTLYFQPAQLGALLAKANSDPEALRQAAVLRQFGVLDSGPMWWTLLSYAFLHGSWTHVGMNAIWLVAFGPPVARRIGATRFLALFAVGAIAGALAHWLVGPMDFNPLIGASASDFAITAAAARFIFQPGGPLSDATGVSRHAPALRGPVVAASLVDLWRDQRARGFVVFWMAANLIFGIGAESLGLADGAVAWVAHIGGFLAGLLLFPLFDRNDRR